MLKLGLLVAIFSAVSSLHSSTTAGKKWDPVDVASKKIGTHTTKSKQRKENKKLYLCDAAFSYDIVGTSEYVPDDAEGLYIETSAPNANTPIMYRHSDPNKVIFVVIESHLSCSASNYCYRILHSLGV